MATGSLRSKIFTMGCLTAVVFAVGGLYAAVLYGSRSPVDMSTRPLVEPAMTPTVGLSRDDVASAFRLEKTFGRLGYRLDLVRDGRAEVPPLFLSQVPHDIDDLPNPDSRKGLFLQVMLPLVLAANEEIAEERTRLFAVIAHRAARKPLSAADAAWVKALGDRYGVPDGDLDRLASRVDAVPPSLALAQAAEETGWGTSRLVRRSRNLFGLTSVSYGPDEDIDGGMGHFASLQDAVRVYLHTLNSHPAYEGLRRARARARARGRPADGHQLAEALRSYSERGDAYVGAIRGLIRTNDLVAFDKARLGHAVPLTLAAVSLDPSR